jgi:hypothetical protein
MADALGELEAIGDDDPAAPDEAAEHPERPRAATAARLSAAMM